MLVLLTWLFFSANASEISCLQLSDNYCSELYSKSNLGNLANIKLGRTQNDIKYSRFYFYQAIQKSIKKQDPDIQKYFKKLEILKTIQQILKRKNPDSLNISDINNPGWSADIIYLIKEALFRVANERTEKKFPGFLKLSYLDSNPFWGKEYYRQLDLIWASFFTQVWQDNPQWKNVEKKFEMLRQEYIEWNKNDLSASADLRLFRQIQLESLSLSIPGSTSNVSYENSLNCGIDEENAYYSNTRHTVTICAGAFIANEALLILAHEIGHSISNSRRISNYIESSSFGSQYRKLWLANQQGQHPTCDEWKIQKQNLQKSLEQLAPYTYEDEKYLTHFISQDLRSIPNKLELNQIGNRLAKKTLNKEIRDHFVNRVIKKIEILETGREIKNEHYLNSETLTRWPLFSNSLKDPASHFSSFFVAEYNCLRNEKNTSETKALEAALIEARTLTSLSWKMILTVGGKYSPYSEPIEEDVVDAYASKITARVLSKMKTVDERRKLYFAATSSFCDPISFRQLYPEETNVLHKFTNLIHSIGKDRRNKILTEDLKPLLHCK